MFENVSHHISECCKYQYYVYCVYSVCDALYAVSQGSIKICRGPCPPRAVPVRYHRSTLCGRLFQNNKPRFNRLTPNDPYTGRTTPLTSKRCILYIYSTNIGTEYFKHALYSAFFFSLQNAVCFIMLTCLVPVLFTFYIQGVLKLKKKIIPAPKS